MKNKFALISLLICGLFPIIGFILSCVSYYKKESTYWTYASIILSVFFFIFWTFLDNNIILLLIF